MKMKRYLFGTAMAACLIGALLTTAAAEEPTAIPEIQVDPTTTNYLIETPSKLIVSGNVTLNGSENAFTINADTELVFEEGASLTLNGYTNGFVVQNATLSGGGWVITDGDGMDLIRLKTGGKLNITDDVDLNGYSKTESASRGVILESTAANGGQQITLAENKALSANNFYRGLETGGAKDYIISGAGMSKSTFDFSGNDCGMALSYFDQNANFKDCKLEVSNCTTSGIFMRQDNAAIWGLNFNGVDINCVNTTPTKDIAVRFHTGPFSMVNSKVTIDKSTTTGFWIYDGWDAARTGSKIENCEITVRNVTDNFIRDQGKAITFAICHDWTITDSTITIDNCGYSGINLSNDTQVSQSGSNWIARANMVGGKLIVTDSTISSQNMDSRKGSTTFSIQVGQFLELGENAVVYNDTDEYPLVTCGKGSDPYPHYRGGILLVNATYDLSNLSEDLRTDDRYFVTGGSIHDNSNNPQVGDRNIPTNEAGEDLKQFAVSAAQFTEYTEDGTFSLINAENNMYTYCAASADPDGYRYIWAPVATVTFSNGQTVEVPRGAAYGLTQATLEGSWYYTDAEGTLKPFTLETAVTGNMTVTAPM